MRVWNIEDTKSQQHDKIKLKKELLNFHVNVVSGEAFCGDLHSRITTLKGIHDIDSVEAMDQKTKF